MKEQNPIDDLFRRELEDYRVTPSAERRAALMGETGRPGFWKPWWLIAVVGIMIGVGIAVVVNRDPGSRIKDAGSRIQDTGSGMQDVKSSINPAIQQPSHPVTQSPSHPATQSPSSPVTQSPSNPATQSPSNPATQSPSSPVAQPPSHPVTQPPSHPVTQPPSHPATQPPSHPVTQPPSDPVTQPPSIQVTQPPGNPPSAIRQEEKEGLPKNWNISAGVYYTPEWMFNTLNGDKFVNNMGVEGTFHFGRYSVRTGVGLSITTGSNEMVVESNPYLGSYAALDSIKFQWDYRDYKLVPTYYTTGTKVYDTSLQYTYSNNKKRYTYLQIPLVLGYDFWQNNWFSLGVRGGAVMSVLLKSQELTDTYDPGQSRVVTINNVSPDRVQLNWQAMAGVNATFRLSRRFSFEVEPDVRYYFNSVYESSQKPWSVGVRAAFVVTW